MYQSSIPRLPIINLLDRRLSVESFCIPLRKSLGGRGENEFDISLEMRKITVLSLIG